MKKFVLNADLQRAANSNSRRLEAEKSPMATVNNQALTPWEEYAESKKHEIKQQVLGGPNPPQEVLPKLYVILEIEPYDDWRFCSRSLVIKEYGGDDTPLFCEYIDDSSLFDLDKFEPGDLVAVRFTKENKFIDKIILKNKIKWINLK